MNQTILLSLIASSLIVYSTVSAEQCTTNEDCTATGCNTGFHVICQHNNATGPTTNGGLCTCAVDDLSCANQADCQSLTLASYVCISDGHKHCYDGKCICTRWRK